MTQHERTEWISEIKKLIARERQEQTKVIENDMKKILESNKNAQSGGR